MDVRIIPIKKKAIARRRKNPTYRYIMFGDANIKVFIHDYRRMRDWLNRRFIYR